VTFPLNGQLGYYEFGDCCLAVRAGYFGCHWVVVLGVLQILKRTPNPDTMPAPSNSDTETTPSRAVVVSDACSAPEEEWKPDYSVTPRRIVCAAIKHKESGRIITGARHFDKIMREQINASEGIASWRGAAQGFIDQFGDFLDREEAWIVAVDQNQIHRRCGGDDGTLFSENLY
jgi:hypothetical protein